MAVRALHIATLLLAIQPLAGCSDNPETADRTGTESGKAATPAPAPSVAENAKLIVAFGDSLYAGYGLGQDEGFAPRLERALVARGIPAQVRNAGVSGETTAGGLQRLAFTLDGQPRKPDLMIVGLGANDMLRGLSPAEARANLDAILTELKTRQIPVVLTGMLAAPNLGADYAASFNAIYPDLAKKFGVPLYPFFLDSVVGNRALLLPDGLHPNAQGVDAIVAHVAPTIAQAVE